VCRRLNGAILDMGVELERDEQTHRALFVEYRGTVVTFSCVYSPIMVVKHIDGVKILYVDYYNIAGVLCHCRR